MKLIIYLTVCFMLFEFLKLLMPRQYWKFSLDRIKKPTLVLIEFVYFCYMVSLFFTQYWFIGLCIFIVSLITAYQLSEDVMTKSSFDKRIKSYLFVDGVVTIIFMLVIILKQFIK